MESCSLRASVAGLGNLKSIYCPIWVEEVAEVRWEADYTLVLYMTIYIGSNYILQ